MGGLTFAVVSGTTVAFGIAFDVSPAVLTSDATDISTSPAQTGFSATVDPEKGLIALHVPAGIGPNKRFCLLSRRPAAIRFGQGRIDNARRANFHGRKPADHREPCHPGHRRSCRRHRHRFFDSESVYT